MVPSCVLPLTLFLGESGLWTSKGTADLNTSSQRELLVYRCGPLTPRFSFYWVTSNKVWNLEGEGVGHNGARVRFRRLVPVDRGVAWTESSLLRS